jgi:hypothetical protein
MEWIDVTKDIEIGEDGRHLVGYYPGTPESPAVKGMMKAFVWNAVPNQFRIRKVMHTHAEGDTVITGACLVVERLG